MHQGGLDRSVSLAMLRCLGIVSGADQYRLVGPTLQMNGGVEESVSLAHEREQARGEVLAAKPTVCWASTATLREHCLANQLLCFIWGGLVFLGGRNFAGGRGRVGIVFVCG